DGSGAACQDFVGYHNSIKTKNANGDVIDVAYAVTNRCGGTIDDVTETASHEFAEASTDPFPYVQPGYVFAQDNAWTILGGENADMCSAVSAVTEGAWSLQRIWSNQNAKIGNQPCQPLPAQPQNIPFFDAGLEHDTLAAHPGDTVTTDVDCYSFGPLPNAMSISVKVNSKTVLVPKLSASTCENGDKLTLSLAVSKTAKKGTDYHYTVTAQIDANTAHIWRGMVHVH